jgi:hypothetical protein
VIYLEIYYPPRGGVRAHQQSPFTPSRSGLFAMSRIKYLSHGDGISADVFVFLDWALALGWGN